MKGDKVRALKRFIGVLLLLSAWVFLYASTSHGATFVVQPGVAVPSTPAPGDSVVFAVGDHTVQQIGLRSGVTYRGATGNRADVRLRGATGNCSGAQATFCGSQVNGATIRDLTIDNGGAVGNGIVLGGQTSNILIANVRVTNVGLSPIVIGQVACTGGVPCTELDLQASPQNVTLSDVEADNGAKTGNGHGVFIRSCRGGVVLLNVSAHHMGTSGDPDGVHATNCPGLRITGGEFFANSEEGIDFSRTASNGNGCNDYMSGLCVVGGARCATDRDCGSSTCAPWVVEGARAHSNGVGGGGAGDIKITSCAFGGVLRNNTLDRNLQLDACPHDIAITGNRLGGLSLFGNNYNILVEGNTIQCASSSSCVRVARGDGAGLHTSVNLGTTWRNNVLGNTLGAAFSTGFQGVTSSAEYPTVSDPSRCNFTTGASLSRSFQTADLAAFKQAAVFGPGTGNGDIWTTGSVTTTTSGASSTIVPSSTTVTTTSAASTTTTSDPWSYLGRNVWTRRYQHDGLCDQLFTAAPSGGMAVSACE